MAKEYFITDVSTWTANNKPQACVQNTLRKFKHVKVTDTCLEDFIRKVESIVEDANYEYKKCKAMEFTCSKLIDGLLLLNVRAGAKDVVAMKLYPILDTWEGTK